MKKLLPLLFILALSGCVDSDKKQEPMPEYYDLICVEETNIAYLQFPKGVAVLLNRHGDPMVCKLENTRRYQIKNPMKKYIEKALNKAGK